MKLRKVALAVALLGCAASAFAAANSSSTVPQAAAKSIDIPAPLRLAVATGLKIVTSFPAKDGLTGWVLSRGPGQSMVVYAPPGGDVVVAGNMLDAQGHNLSEEYLQKYAPKPDYSKYWSDIQKAKGFYSGPAPSPSAKGALYVFEDPNCPYCHLIWQNLKPLEAKGLTVHWIPVAFEAPDSANKAAAILSSRNPSEVNDKWQEQFRQPDPALTNFKVSPEMDASLKANLKLMASLGMNGTPAIVWRDASGKIHSQDGLLSLEQLQSIAKAVQGR